MRKLLDFIGVVALAYMSGVAWDQGHYGIASIAYMSIVFFILVHNPEGIRIKRDRLHAAS